MNKILEQAVSLKWTAMKKDNRGLLSTSNGIPLPSDIPTAEETNAAKLDYLVRPRLLKTLAFVMVSFPLDPERRPR
jgi:hypothetical protein